MAGSYRAEKSGFAKEMEEKLAEKFDKAEAGKCLRWIRALPTPTPPQQLPSDAANAANEIPPEIQEADPDEFHRVLFNGFLLGYLMAAIEPGSVNWSSKTWQSSDKPVFETSRQRERIGLFLKFVEKFGVGGSFLFQTDQLYERTNLNQVVICLSTLAVEAQSRPNYQGPPDMWPHKSQVNKRVFTEEQMRAGQGVIGLQMGTNKGANASGVAFGARRFINDTH